MPTYRVLAAALFLCFGTPLMIRAARAADFRVDNAVFAEGQSQPQSQGVTIFYEGLVFDFLNDPAEVIVFDKAHRRFILLNISRRVRSEIPVDDVKAFVDRARQYLSGHPNLNVRWLAAPTFDESFDADSAELTLKSPAMTYRARVMATDPAVAAQYHEFSDSYAQFNHLLNPKSWPPFPRLMLNDALARHKGIAKEVHLSAALNPNDALIKITSRHQLSAELSKADVQRVAEAREYMQKFQSVTFPEYRRGK